MDDQTMRIVKPVVDDERKKCESCGSPEHPLMMNKAGQFLCFDQVNCSDRRKTVQMEPVSKVISCSRCGAIESVFRYSLASGEPVCMDNTACVARALERRPREDPATVAMPALSRTTTKPEAKAITIDLADHEQLIEFLKYLVKLLERGDPVRITVE
jgi:hypothetical protein